MTHLGWGEQEAWHGMRRLPAGFDPCTGEYIERYFNREDVQKALHANITHLSYPYSGCRYYISSLID